MHMISNAYQNQSLHRLILVLHIRTVLIHGMSLVQIIIHVMHKDFWYVGLVLNSIRLASGIHY